MSASTLFLSDIVSATIKAAPQCSRVIKRPERHGYIQNGPSKHPLVDLPLLPSCKPVHFAELFVRGYSHPRFADGHCIDPFAILVFDLKDSGEDGTAQASAGQLFIA